MGRSGRGRCSAPTAPRAVRATCGSSTPPPASERWSGRWWPAPCPPSRAIRSRASCTRVRGAALPTSTPSTPPRAPPPSWAIPGSALPPLAAWISGPTASCSRPSTSSGPRRPAPRPSRRSTRPPARARSSVRSGPRAWRPSRSMVSARCTVRFAAEGWAPQGSTRSIPPRGRPPSWRRSSMGPPPRRRVEW